MQHLCIWLIVTSMAMIPLGHAQNNEVVFATGEYSPFASESLPEKGAAVALISAINRAAGIKPLYQFYPWRRAESLLASGEAFGAFPYSKNVKRQSSYRFSDPLYMVRNSVVYFSENTKTSTPIRFEKLDDLRPYRIGLLLGSFAENDLRKLGIPFESTSTVDQSIKKLRTGRIDLYIDDHTAIFDAVQRLYPSEATQFRALPKDYNAQVANYLMVSINYPGSEELLTRFNDGLRRIKETGEYDLIVKKFGLTPAR